MSVNISRFFAVRNFLIVDSALGAAASLSPSLTRVDSAPPLFGMMTAVMSPGLLGLFTGQGYALAHETLATVLLNAVLAPLTGAIPLLFLLDSWSRRARCVTVLLWGVLYALLVGVLFRGDYAI